MNTSENYDDDVIELGTASIETKGDQKIDEDTGGALRNPVMGILAD